MMFQFRRGAACLLLGSAMFVPVGCNGGPSPENDDPPPASAVEMTEDEIEKERELGAPPREKTTSAALSLTSGSTCQLATTAPVPHGPGAATTLCTSG